MNRILTYPNDNALLRRKSKRVKNPQDTEVVIAVQTMKRLCSEWESENPGKRAEGMAAPQIGVPLRIVIIRKTDQNVEDPWLVLYNPIYVKAEGMQESEEQCLSVPGKIGKLLRPKRSIFHYFDHNLKRVPPVGPDPEKPGELYADDQSSINLCHELDHLNGVLFIDSAYEISDESPGDFNESDSTSSTA